MKKNILKKFIIPLNLFVILFGFNYVFADDVQEVVPVNIHLEVISGTDIPIYNDNILVNPCDSDNDPATPDTVTPYCALVQVNILSDWSGLWINSIGGVANDFTNNLFWMWLANLNIDNTTPTSSYNLSAKQYKLNENNKILFYYNTNPLNIFVDSLTPTVGSGITISIKELGLDSSWSPIWSPAVSSKVIIGSDIFDTDDNGEYKLSITSTDPIIIKGHKDGFIESPLVTITPVASTEQENVEQHNTYNSGGSIENITQKNFSLENALSFLSSNQKDDGSFGNSLYTDWVTIGVAKAGSNANQIVSKLKDYLKDENFEGSSVTDYERHAMALMALGINPYTGTSINYIKKITDSFDGTQIGDKNLFNDDIFGLIVLENAGLTKNDEIIKNTIVYIISRQSSDGSWGSVDMTSAGIEALSNFKSVEGVKEAIGKAENYIIGAQNTDGGFSNSSSTSWVIQALSFNNSLNVNVDNAIKYITAKQQDDGGLDGSDISNRVWVTSYTIPAILKLPWNDILEFFDKPESNQAIERENNATEIPPVKELKDLIVVIPQDKVLLADGEKKDIPIKVVKVPKKKINNIKIKPIYIEKLKDNNLEVSAGNFNQNESQDTFLSGIHKVLKKIASPFVWLWNHVGF